MEVVFLHVPRGLMEATENFRVAGVPSEIRTGYALNANPNS
jgi:hypothetical protein